MFTWIHHITSMHAKGKRHICYSARINFAGTEVARNAMCFAEAFTLQQWKAHFDCVTCRSTFERSFSRAFQLRRNGYIGIQCTNLSIENNRRCTLVWLRCSNVPNHMKIVSFVFKLSELIAKPKHINEIILRCECNQTNCAIAEKELRCEISIRIIRMKIK